MLSRERAGVFSLPKASSSAVSATTSAYAPSLTSGWSTQVYRCRHHSAGQAANDLQHLPADPGRLPRLEQALDFAMIGFGQPREEGRRDLVCHGGRVHLELHLVPARSIKLGCEQRRVTRSRKWFEQAFGMISRPSIQPSR